MLTTIEIHGWPRLPNESCEVTSGQVRQTIEKTLIHSPVVNEVALSEYETSAAAPMTHAARPYLRIHSPMDSESQKMVDSLKALYRVQCVRIEEGQ